MASYSGALASLKHGGDAGQGEGALLQKMLHTHKRWEGATASGTMQYDIGPNHCRGWPSQRRALVPPVSKPTLFFHQLSPERFIDTRDRSHPSLTISLGARVLVFVRAREVGM